MKTLLKCIYSIVFGIATFLALFVINHWPSYQRVSALLAQEANQPSQEADNSLGGLLDETTAPKVKVDENAPLRSLHAQLMDLMSDNEFVAYLGLTGKTAEQLDKEEEEFLRIIQSNPDLYLEHLHEAAERKAKSTFQSLADTFGENWASTIDTNNFFIQMTIYSDAEREALEFTKRGWLTDRKQEEEGMKEILAKEREDFQSKTESIASRKRYLKTAREMERWRPTEERKYDRMDRELSLAQMQAAYDLHVPLWVHLGILPEDAVHKQDKTLKYFDLLNMSIRIGKEAMRKDREIWNAADPVLKARINAEKAKQYAIFDREDTLTNEAELERWIDFSEKNYDLAASIAVSDAEFAKWRASVNENAAPPAQNPGGLLPEETKPAPVTNANDGGETTPAPAPGDDEETTSGNLGDDAAPGSPTVPGGLE